MAEAIVKFSQYTEDELFALAAANAPNPTQARIEQFHRYDLRQNPYNDPDKPLLRTEIEIIADYKLDFAKILFARMKERL